jgi:hypothetical protein
MDRAEARYREPTQATQGRPCATLIATIFGGTIEIMKEIIGRNLGL